MKGILLSILLVFSSFQSIAEICKLQRDPDGSIHRSYTEFRHFKEHNPCPDKSQKNGSCKGYVVDHIKPLCDCGADKEFNMQWQDIAEAKIKDKYERQICAVNRKLSKSIKVRK